MSKNSKSSNLQNNLSQQHQTPSCPLGKLKRGVSAIIIRVGMGTEGESQGLVRRLLEMGFLEGSRVEIIHEGLFGKDPIAVRVRGALIALRRAEADLVEVVPLKNSSEKELNLEDSLEEPKDVEL